MKERDIRQAVSKGYDAARRADELRQALRWKSKPTAAGRQKRIASAIERLDKAMRPIRSFIGRLVWEPIPDDLEHDLREASAAIQYERRQLKKMQRRES